MQWGKRQGRVVALVVVVIVLLSTMTVQAQAQTAPVTPGLACEGVACVEQLKNSKAMAEQLASLRLEWMKNPTSLFLDGETRLACECALCLAAGPHAPKECQAALAKYYLIQASSPFHTLVLRQHFLLRCPKK